MKPKNFKSQNLIPTLFALILFAIMIAASLKFANYKKGLWEKDIRSNLLTEMNSKKSKLEKALYSRIYYTRGVAAYISIKPEITNSEFYTLADEYINRDSVISTMAISKNCVINAIYPLEGHESAIGLDLLRHPERKEIVNKTIETHKTFIAGPVELVEGGIAFISYTPIFNNSSGEFWGVTDIVIKQNSLLNEAGLKKSGLKYKYALRGYNGTGNEGKIFWGDFSVFDNSPVYVNIELPTGNWVLAGTPLKDWKYYANQDQFLLIILLIASLIICVLLWLFIKALLKIRNNEKELRALFNSLDSILIEFDENGNYLKVNSINEEILIVPKGKLIGKNIKDFFAGSEAEKQIAAIRKCIREKKLVEIEYALQLKDKKHFFMAKISYKNDHSVIYNSYDITELKEQEKKLQQSKNELFELNQSKDKLFSIVAHDLKGPIGAQKALLDITVNEYDEMSDKKKKDILINLKDSSYKLNNLLENLLNWSTSQAGRINTEKSDFNLNQKYSEIHAQMQRQADLKNIKIKGNIEDNLWINTNPNLIEIILRNLISNAIKFTGIGGEINIYTKNTDDNKSVNVYVSDNGVGIKNEKLTALFKIGHNNSTPGTEGEMGNGLGLILCQELAEKLGSGIQVESTENEGSTFYFKLTKTSQN